MGRDDACAGTALEAERRTDGEYPLADPRIRCSADFHRRQVLAVDLQDRDVAGGIETQHLGLEFPLVGELDDDLLGAVHDVGIGQKWCRRR